MNGAPSQPIWLLYDKQCPLCHAYCRMARIRDAVGELRLVDAREQSQLRQQITEQGLDIDQGMVLKLGDQLYYGADAIHALALISSRSGLFNRLNYWLFKSRWRAGLLYPALRAVRNMLLKLLRKSRINNLDLPGNQYF